VAPTPPVTRVLVAGSRAFADYPLLCATLDRLLAGRGRVAVVSGGAGGADRLGERYAAARGLPVERFVPAWAAHGRAAGPIRNREMVPGCGLAVFFWDGRSPGTADAVARARRAGVPVEVVRYADPARPPGGPPPAPAAARPAAVPPPAPPPAAPPPRKLLDRVRDACRVRHYSIRTEDAYADWVKRFVLFHAKRHPADMGEPEVNAYLTHLAVAGGVAASTQFQALCALLFLYAHVLGRPLDRLRVARAARPDRLPVILSRDEVRAVLDRLTGVPRLVGLLMYGGGLRVLEAVRVRVHHLDFDRAEVFVRAGKGGVDRRTLLPRAAADGLREHLARVRAQHDRDVAAGGGRVYLPEALARKYPHADREWGWQYVFPARSVSTDPRSGAVRRHHLSEQAVQKAVKAAAGAAGVGKPVTPHVFRHAFATHLIESGKDPRTVQTLLGHKSLETTMVYVHVLNQGGLGVQSPADLL
jgi:integron integrase